MVWTLKRLRYTHDLATEANLCLVVQVVARTVKIIWKEHVKRNDLLLIDISTWLKELGKIYDDYSNKPAVKA